jgi:hypothetical protein
MLPSQFHRGDYKRVRHAANVAVIELEVLEVRMQVAYKQGLIPPKVAADLSLARLLAVELERLLRKSLDVGLAQSYEVYADATYNREGLVA